MSTPIVAALVFTIGLVIVANIAFRRARKANELPAEEDPDIRAGGPSEPYSDRYMPPPPQRKYHSGGYVKGPAPEVLPRGESRPLRYSDKRRMGLEPHKPSKVKHETRDDRGDLTSTDTYAGFATPLFGSYATSDDPRADYAAPSSSDSFSGGGGDFGGGGSSGGWSDSGSSSSSDSSSYDSGSSSSSSCD